jgi:hypothetical protein
MFIKPPWHAAHGNGGAEAFTTHGARHHDRPRHHARASSSRQGFIITIGFIMPVPI